MRIVAGQIHIRRRDGLLWIRCAYERNADSCGSGPHKKGIRIVGDQILIRQMGGLLRILQVRFASERNADTCVSGSHKKGMKILADKVRMKKECGFL